MILIIEDNEVMGELLARYVRPKKAKIVTDGVAAMAAIERELPEAILLDVLLDGPDGFAVLNELSSYKDTMRIPIIIVSSLDLEKKDLKSYGVVRILNKNKMTPTEVREAVSAVIGEGRDGGSEDGG